MQQPPKPPITRKQYAIAILYGLVTSGIVSALPYVFLLVMGMLSPDEKENYKDFVPVGSMIYMFGLPVIQGFVTGRVIGLYKFGLWRYIATGGLLMLIDLLLAYILFKEGYLCLVFGAPIYLGLIGAGLSIGRAMAEYKLRNRLQLSVIPLLLLTAAYDAHSTPPQYHNEIADTVIVNAPPEIVWNYIVQYPVNPNPPEYWLWKAGLPMPTHSTANAAAIGANRECRFTNGIVFEERITRVVPGELLTFDITRQPDHPEIIGHFSLDKGEIRLKGNPDGTTTVTAVSWYRLFVRPAPYFDLWAEDIVRNVHFRVLNYMKALAEKEKSAT